MCSIKVHSCIEARAKDESKQVKWDSEAAGMMTLQESCPMGMSVVSQHLTVEVALC